MGESGFRIYHSRALIIEPWNTLVSYTNGRNENGICPSVRNGLNGVVDYIVEKLGVFKSGEEIPIRRNPPVSGYRVMSFDQRDIQLVLDELRERKPNFNFVLA